MNILANVIIDLLSSFLWRVRGGWRIPGTDKKVPLNKIWFALFYAAAFVYRTHGDWNTFAVCAIATLVSYQEYGWGEYVACEICHGKPSERSDCSLVDDIIDNIQFTIKGITYKLTDFPRLFGFVGLSLRGLIMTFTIGLAFQNIPYMFTGLAMGTVYGIGGLISRYIISDGKDGWRWAEWLWGLYMGIILNILT